MNRPIEIIKWYSQNHPEQEEVKNQTDSALVRQWLSDPNWQIRNNAVKVIGLTGSSEYCDDIVSLIADRQPASFLNRLLGGDFYQVGFIRRNAAGVLAHLGVTDQRVEKSIKIALTDPYWEVRSEILRTTVVLYPESLPVSLFDPVVKCLRDSSFEVIVEALKLIGQAVCSDILINLLRPLYNHPNFLVKQQLRETLICLYKCGAITSKDELIKESENIFIPGKY